MMNTHDEEVMTTTNDEHVTAARVAIEKATPIVEQLALLTDELEQCRQAGVSLSPVFFQVGNLLPIWRTEAEQFLYPKTQTSARRPVARVLGVPPAAGLRSLRWIWRA